jgi:hypothetical protein
MYKSPEEINEIFGIDITEKNRTIQFVALRAFYAEDRVKQLKGRITSIYVTVSNEIGCGRDNVYNLLTKGEIFKKDECIKIIFEAFKTKDKGLLKEYEKQLRKTRALNHSEKNLKMFNDGINYAQKPSQVGNTEKTIIKMSNLKLAEFLRANKVLKHDLWDVPVRNISTNQWKQVRKINPKMFEEIVNS